MRKIICKEEFILHLFSLVALSSSGSATISILGWNCKVKLLIFFLSIYILYCFLYLVVVKEVYADLHDAREDHQDGGGDEEVVDVVK